MLSADGLFGEEQSLRPKFWTYYSWNNFVRVKPIALVMKDVAESAEMDHQPLLPSVNKVVTDGDAAIGAAVVSAPKRRLGVFDLVFFGVGSTVGACPAAVGWLRVCPPPSAHPPPTSAVAPCSLSLVLGFINCSCCVSQARASFP